MSDEPHLTLHDIVDDLKARIIAMEDHLFGRAPSAAVADNAPPPPPPDQVVDMTPTALPHSTPAAPAQE